MNKFSKIVAGTALGGAALVALAVWLAGRDPTPKDVLEQLHQDRPQDFETPAQTFDRLRSEAKAQMMVELTNDQIGLQRIISATVNDVSAQPTNWEGRATVEFVNHIGGVDRTNLFYKFEVWQGHVLASLDAMKMYRQVDDAAANGR